MSLAGSSGLGILEEEGTGCTGMPRGRTTEYHEEEESEVPSKALACQALVLARRQRWS